MGEGREGRCEMVVLEESDLGIGDGVTRLVGKKV